MHRTPGDCSRRAEVSRGVICKWLPQREINAMQACAVVVREGSGWWVRGKSKRRVCAVMTSLAGQPSLVKHHSLLGQFLVKALNCCFVYGFFQSMRAGNHSSFSIVSLSPVKFYLGASVEC